MTTQTCLPAQQPRGGHGDYQRAVHLQRAAASEAAQSDARRQWIRAATQC
ncbi:MULTISPECIES: hypothetical protein [Mycolicibacter]|nr:MULTISPECIES: hypothetical protein [Mycolicibacter]